MEKCKFMEIVFLSNYMSHHQFFLSEELYKATNGRYTFVATESISEERINLGWQEIKAPYIMELTEINKKEIESKIMAADAVIIGSAPYHLVKKRIRANKLTFTYGERPYKKEPSLLTLLVHKFRYMSQYHYPNVYRLCASAFSPIDYARTNTFVGKSFRWGYFPEVRIYDDFESMYNSKIPNSILWCGRLIDWKHPEVAVSIAKRLKDEGIAFKMDIIGSGYMYEEIAELIKSQKIDSEVTLHSSMTPEKIREYMEKSSIYLFTSDRQEGWGAVLNEAMNSGCAVVANSAIGAVPFLLKDKVNGYIYEDGKINQASNIVKELIQDKNVKSQISSNAYRSITCTWNSHVAADRLIQLIEALQNKTCTSIFREGPCSVAPVLEDNWYNKKQK